MVHAGQPGDAQAILERASKIAGERLSPDDILCDEIRETMTSVFLGREMFDQARSQLDQLGQTSKQAHASSSSTATARLRQLTMLIQSHRGSATWDAALAAVRDAVGEGDRLFSAMLAAGSPPIPRRQLSPLVDRRLRLLAVVLRGSPGHVGARGRAPAVLRNTAAQTSTRDQRGPAALVCAA